MINNYSITVLTVTYGSRFKYLQDVITACLDLGIEDIVVVNNNSEDDIAKIVDNKKIHLISFEKNTGSANGYAKGLSYINSNLKCDFVYLLDDDNVPDKMAIIKLLEFYSQSKNHKLVLQSYRPEYKMQDFLFYNKNYQILFRSNNYFLGFGLFRMLPLVLNKLFGNKKTFVRKVAMVPYTQYGGLFFNKKLISEVGLPKSEFYLYGDDADFTYRMTLAGYKIYVLFESKVHDVDVSWHNTITKRKVFFNSLEKGEDWKVFYSVRNHIWFENKYFKTNKYIYCINKYIYLLMMLFVAIAKSRIQRFKLILNAVFKGEIGELGKI